MLLHFVNQPKDKNLQVVSQFFVFSFFSEKSGATNRTTTVQMALGDFFC
jgi:hypothetical protein